MLRSSRLRGRPLALLVLQVADLPELETLFGHHVAKHVVLAIMKALSALAGHAGLAVRTSHDIFSLLLPRCTGEQLERAVRAGLGRACSLEMDFGNEEIVLLPEIQACTVGQGESIESAYCALRRALESRQYLKELRDEHVPREREAHSTPIGLPRDVARQDPAGADWKGRRSSPTLPATIAMPLRDPLASRR